ncbi:P-II family nitrogen regulator [Nesterenkonia sp. PF2B19]|uniref:P-II family nitrogen regulator n=1 Tax=unclassified Nesterenkonia TaxID=2629769 RepID=UPI0008724B20|nr:transcriptional regulator [Nesterenkonia sp. PF2B19]OSM42234.1 transcriptional regulator [Nesterenkonia sp. PF2B19]
MEPHARKLLTIVTEAALEGKILRDLEQLGTRGHTITDARGKGRRGVRDAGWEASANIRVEVVCDAGTAQAVSAYLREHYYRDYAMTVWVIDVEVLRPEKF